jgi:general secretion pathway protein J
VKRGTPPRPLRAQAGFTLVETLVAIALLSLLTAALTASLRFGLDAWAKGTAHSDQLSRTLTVQGLLRRTLQEAYPYFVFNDPACQCVDFDGARDALMFLAYAPAALGGSGRSRFRLSVTRHEGLSDLVMTSQAELAAGGSPSSEEKTLLAGAASVEFSYFGRLRTESGAKWHDQWSRQTVLPQLLRIQVRFAEGDARRWPALVIAPRIIVDAGCVYDQLTKQCRGR